MKYRSLIKRISALVLFLCCIPGSLEVSAATALDTESSGQVEWLDSKVTTTKPDNVVIDTTRLTVTLLHEYSDYFETIEENYFNDSRILSIVDTLPPSDTIPELLDLNYFRKILVLDLDVDSESDLDSLVQSLEQRSDVRSVSYSYYYNVSATSTALTGNEIMPLNTQTNFWYDKVNLVNAWNYTQGSPDIKVGVIDASFYSHPHIDDNLWINSGEIPNNSIDDDGNGFIDDYAGFDCENLDGNVYRAPIDDDYADGHGLSVAGLIAGEPNGVYPYLSVAPQCKLVLLYSQSNVSSTVAVQYAIRNNVQILNESQESSGSNESFLSALQQYKGLFVCAAGNDGLDLSDSTNTSSCYPSQYALGNMICVTGMNKIGTYNSEYNYGNTIVDVAAPCRSVNVCSPSDVITNMDDGMTSCAAPIVTGIAALLKSYYPSATTEMIKHAILFSVQKGSTFSGKVRMGGYVNAENALQLLETQMPLKPNPTTPFFIRNKETGQYLTMQSDKSITQTNFTGSSNQKWILSNYNNGYYVIQSYQNQTYRMDVDNASSANGTIVKAHVYTGYDDAQSFRFQQTTDGNYYIYPKVADGVDRCLQINGTDKLRIYNNNALTTQQWCLQSSSFFDSSQTYYLRNKHTGRYLTVTELESGGYSLGLSSYLGDYSSKRWKFTTDGTTPYKQISSALNTTLLLGFNTNDSHSVSSNFFYHYAKVDNSLEYNDLQLIPQSDGSYKIATEDSIPYQIYNTDSNQYVTCTAQRNLIDFNGTPGFSIDTNITPDSNVWILEDASVIDEIESRQYYIVNHCNMKAFSYVTPIQLTNYKDTNYYRFTFEYRGNGNYRIHDAISGQYLVAYNANNKIALSLTYSNTDANTWKFQVMENGLFTIVNSADSAKGMRIQTISDTNISYSELAPAYEQDIKQHWSIFYELSE